MDVAKQKHWEDAFKNATEYSGPNSRGLTISKAKPKEGRDIFDEDEEEIMYASKKYGYSVISNSPKVIVFYKKL